MWLHPSSGASDRVRLAYIVHSGATLSPNSQVGGGVTATIDVCILLLFIAFAVASGLRERKQASESLEQYFLAGRSLRGVPAGISMAATQFAADTPLLVTGMIATAGVFSLWRLWIYAVAFLVLGFVLAPCWRRAQVLTDAELSELRYGGRAAAGLRAFKALYFGTLFNCTVLAMVLFAAKEIAEPFLLWHQWLPAHLFAGIERAVVSIGIEFARSGTHEVALSTRSTDNVISLCALLSVTTLYSSTGGLRSVVRTDVMQFSLMIAATAGYAVWIMNEVGGMEAVHTALRRASVDGTVTGLSPDQLLTFTPGHAKDASLALLVVFSLQWLVQMNSDGTGYLAQRVMACRSDRDARLATLVFTFAQVGLRSLLWLPIGLGVLVLFPPDPELLGTPGLIADREASFVTGMAALPPGLRGLMLTAMLAALASTIDTHLNWGASYWTHDIYARFLYRHLREGSPSPRSLVWVARLSNVLILAIAIFIMTRLSSIQLAWRASLLLGAGMGVVLLLRWFWWRVTARAEIAALVCSALLVPLMLNGALLDGQTTEQEALRLLAIALVSTGGAVAVSLLGKPESMERLREFHARVRPPGFWGPVSADGEEGPEAGPRRLRTGMITVLLCCFTLFAWLTGIGSYWIGSPPPVWFPWRGPWIAGLLIGGLAVVPLWWRRVRE